MAMTLAQYINDPTVRQGVDVDHAYGDQCWDLVEDYAQRVLNVPKEPWALPLGPQISAKEAWTYFDQSPHMQKYFDRIPAGKQQPGDIMVYNGHGVYTEGHIAICVDGNVVFEQNADPDGSLPHMANRAPTYLLGALRRKQGAPMPTEDWLQVMHRMFYGVPSTPQWVQDTLKSGDNISKITADMANYALANGLANEQRLATISDLQKQLAASKPGSTAATPRQLAAEQAINALQAVFNK